MRRILLPIWLIAAVASTIAQTPAADLVAPPATARHLIIQSTGGKHGDSWLWTAPDGARMGRESMNLRGQVWEIDTAMKPGTDGMPASVVVRGVTPQGDAAETARYLEIPLGLVQAAISYYGAYRAEIDQWIEANEQQAAEAHAAWSAGQDAIRP